MAVCGGVDGQANLSNTHTETHDVRSISISFYTQRNLLDKKKWKHTIVDGDGAALPDEPGQRTL